MGINFDDSKLPFEVTARLSIRFNHDDLTTVAQTTIYPYVTQPLFCQNALRLASNGRDLNDASQPSLNDRQYHLAPVLTRLHQRMGFRGFA